MSNTSWSQDRVPGSAGGKRDLFTKRPRSTQRAPPLRLFDIQWLVSPCVSVCVPIKFQSGLQPSYSEELNRLVRLNCLVIIQIQFLGGNTCAQDPDQIERACDVSKCFIFLSLFGWNFRRGRQLRKREQEFECYPVPQLPCLKSEDGLDIDILWPCRTYTWLFGFLGFESDNRGIDWSIMIYSLWFQQCWDQIYGLLAICFRYIDVLADAEDIAEIFDCSQSLC